MTHSPLPLSGLADEAADDLGGQIAAHRELGWSRIELRQIDGQQVASPLFSEAQFERAAEALQAAGISVSSYATAIGNWNRPIQGDFQLDLADLRVLLKRMQRTSTPWARTMSWVGAGADSIAWRDEAVSRYREMAKMAADANVFLLHENCEGWGGQSASHLREFVERVNHPHLGVLFDIGNTVAYGHDAWAFYSEIKPLIRYVHVKDCKKNPAGGKSANFTFPGEGDACLLPILQDLLRSGYSAGLSIEPHVTSIIHLGDSAASAQDRYDSYVTYARLLESLLSTAASPPTATPAG